jgi:pyrimidine operon attenuation protein/uracil phosphoribosyltransferase
MARMLRRMAGEVVEREGGATGVVLVGIRTRGVEVAARLAQEIAEMEGMVPPSGTLDITLYRDDLSTIAPQPLVKASDIPVEIEGKVVVLCDDVLYTGRTVRAALDALMDYGRPRAVRLAVLVDRGHRELPIQADYVGTTVETAARDLVEVAFPAIDGREEVVLVAGGSSR